MAVVDDKVIERVARLLRLAAPSSNTTLHEREVAAVEAARLIEEHDLVLVKRETRRSRAAHYESSYREESAPPPPRARRASSTTGWSLRQVDFQTMCGACHNRISKGDVVWVRLNGDETSFLHNYSPCYFDAS